MESRSLIILSYMAIIVVDEKWKISSHRIQLLSAKDRILLLQIY